MTLIGWIQIVVFFALLLVLVKPLGAYMAKVFQGQATFLSRAISPLERFIYRLAGVDESKEMTWKTYAVALLAFNFLGILVLYAILRLQGVFSGSAAVAPDLSFNTAVSFVTNTNWQNYAGESTLSSLTQMVGLTVQNFLSAATGITVFLAFTRSLARHSASTLGNFWVDLTRSILYILLPLSFILALVFVSQGVVQTFSSSIQANLVQPIVNSSGQTVNQQIISVGPVASQLAIKHLGTNGGGFFNANAAHPFENPSAVTNLLLMLAQMLLPAALTYTFGKMVGEPKQGWAILTAMVILLVLFVGLTYSAETAGNPLFSQMGIDQTASAIQAGGNMEGKEARFGISASALFAGTTTATSNGAVNSMHDSFTPLGGLSLLLLMQLGEVVFGGVGSGMYGMLIFVIVAVFVAGLMVGRTPEYLGKKIEPFEMKMAALVILIMPMVVLGLTALAVSTQAGQAAVLNPGPHAFSEILYAFTSQGNNNGSAFAGLSGNSLFYNITGAIAMLIGRFWLIIPTLALAGSLVQKKKAVASAGTLSTTSALFIGWLIAIILIVGALNFVPALSLGPLAEHLLMVGI
ncbi:MAG: potassium-transporting ATPase subunit KdpA [Anaerolineaceae bacterium]|nr:potassium-transporting ATPase subunit KdpA [Anaerolineaceae bacterium]